MLTYRFHVPTAAIASTKKAIESPAFQESLRLREALGYLPGDRRALVENVPAVLLTGLSISRAGAATATLEPLSTLEGKIVRCLGERLDADEYSFEIVRDKHTGRPTGMDFALADNVTRARLRRVMRDVFDDADGIADALIDKPSEPLDVPARKQDDGMIGQGLIDRVRAILSNEADALAASRSEAEYARKTGGGDESTHVQYL